MLIVGNDINSCNLHEMANTNYEIGGENNNEELCKEYWKDDSDKYKGVTVTGNDRETNVFLDVPLPDLSLTLTANRVGKTHLNMELD